jgi:hypothetical protein
VNRDEWEKEDYKSNVKRLLEQPVKNSKDINRALGYLKAIEFFCKVNGWNVIEILGGVIDDQEDKTETESKYTHLRYASA